MSLLLLCSVFVPSLASTALAQGSAAIDPPITERVVTPGETVRASIRVTNPERLTLDIRVYPQDWSFDPDGSLAFDPPGTLERSAASWIDYAPVEFALEPGGVATVEYEVRVPSGIQPGSYWAVLFVEGRPQGEVRGGAGFRVRLGHVLFLDVPPLDESGAIRGIFTDDVRESGVPAKQFGVFYANTGTTVQEVTGYIEIQPFSGGDPLRIPVDAVTVLPNSERLITRRLVGPLAGGDYLVLVVLNYGDPEVDVAGETTIRLDQPLPRPIPLGESPPADVPEGEGEGP